MLEYFERQEEVIERFKNDDLVQFVREDKNGTKIFADCRCGRCGGDGRIWFYSHVEQGVCFECGGTGTSRSTEIKVYTPEYGAKLLANRKARAEKKRQEMLAGSESRRKEWMEREGFNEDGNTWVFLGNTYEVKEQIKELGAKFNYLLGWHINHAVEGYPTMVINVKDITTIDYIGNIDYCRAYTPEGGDAEYDSYSMEQRINELKEEAYAEFRKNSGELKSEYIGTVGERRDFVCKLVSHFAFDSAFVYGDVTHIYRFEDENGNIIIWKTGNWLDDEQKDFSFKATIKEHSEYKGEKQTVVQRPKFF